MENNEYNLEESQKKLMELLVSRTLKKHGIQKDANAFTDQEKQNLKDMVEHLQKQFELLTNTEKSITEHDVNSETNTYKIENKKSE